VRLRFGVFQVDLAARELRKHGERIRLSAQPFRVLSILLEKPGETVTREEMRVRLWASDTFVDFEHSLNSAIKKLRFALGDSPERPLYIETIPRSGYRFVAPVKEVSADSAVTVETSSPAVQSSILPASAEEPSRRRWLSPISVLALLVVMGVIAWLGLRVRPNTKSRIAGEIHAANESGESAKLNGEPALSPKSAEAHDLYLKGLYFWNKRTVTGFQQAISYFRQATIVDPNYAPGYAGLANCYTLLTAYSSDPSSLYIPQARTAAARAVQLDDRSAEAHTALALIIQNHDWDWRTSDKEYRRATELNPNYATGHQWYAEHLMWLGRFDEALREGDRARNLDPLSLIIAADYGAILYYSRDYDRAIEQLRSVLRKDPNFLRAASMLTYAYVEKGMYAQALAEEEVLTRLYGQGSRHWMMLAYIYGRGGQTERARSALEKMEKLSRQEQVSPVFMLWAHLGIGDKEEALADLEKAYAEHSMIMVTLKVDPAFDPLRGDQRFQDLLRRVGLDDSGTANFR
jgi:DNA-binding winged helix-turn-helix (wHTH) protein/Tfp pilus assembly protein PilF